ncbi:MAG: SCP2 sterol-binding domain-containing protein [Myxococcales bacterium]|nr:SCP2 sterol-binding domain-containing protein [Myxococcales bacterium]
MTTRATSASQFFNQLLPAALAARPADACAIGGIHAFKISGEGGGEWTVHLASSAPKISQGILPEAGCTITVSSEDFVIWNGDPQVGSQLYFSGRMRVSGDPSLMSKSQQIFTLV